LIINKAFKFDGFLSSVEDYSIFELFNVKVKNEYYKLPKIVKKCRKLLEEAEKHPRYDDIPTPQNEDEVDEILLRLGLEDAQEYEHQISLPIGEDFYNIIWSITKAQKVIKKYKLEPMHFMVDYIADGLAPGSVDNNYIDKARNNKEPIIAIKYPLLSSPTRMIVIDGNHRLAASIKDNQQFILGYSLNPAQQYEALAGELDRAVYTVHNNLSMIIEYMIGNVSKSKLKQFLLPF
jgi:hypothetical protein